MTEKRDVTALPLDKDAFTACVERVLDDDRWADSAGGEVPYDVRRLATDAEALMYRVTMLVEALQRIQHFPFDVGHSPERDLREIKAIAEEALRV